MNGGQKFLTTRLGAYFSSRLMVNVALLLLLLLDCGSEIVHNFAVDKYERKTTWQSDFLNPVFVFGILHVFFLFIISSSFSSFLQCNAMRCSLRIVVCSPGEGLHSFANVTSSDVVMSYANTHTHNQTQANVYTNIDITLPK